MSDEARDQNRARAGHVISAAFIAGAVVGLSPAILGILFGWVTGTMPILGIVLTTTAFLAPILGIAAIILIAPTQLLAMRFVAPYSPRLARWLYLAPSAFVAFLLYGFNVSATTHYQPIFDVAGLATMFAFAAPAALVFYLAVNRTRQPPGGWMLAVLALVWLATYFVALFGVPLTQRVSVSPLATRDHIIIAWTHQGRIAMFLTGLIAYAIWQSRMPHTASGLLVAGTIAPVAFVAWYFAVPLGEGYAHFSLGKRAVAIDWRREPFEYNGALNFNIADLEPYRIAGRRAVNKNLQVRPAIGSLHLGELPAASRDQWGLRCYDTRFHDRAVSVCGQPGLPEHWTTKVWIEKGYAHQSFDRDGVRYGLHYDVEDVQNWRHIERAAIGALEAADMSRK